MDKDYCIENDFAGQNEINARIRHREERQMNSIGQWQSVKDRLPKKFGPHLVKWKCFPDEDPDFSYNVMIWAEGKNRFINLADDWSKTVPTEELTHWAEINPPQTTFDKMAEQARKDLKDGKCTDLTPPEGE